MALSDESVVRRLGKDWFIMDIKVSIASNFKVLSPFGIVVHLHGPGEGKRHDAGMLCESGLLADLQQNMQHFPSGVYSLYGHLTCWLL